MKTLIGMMLFLVVSISANAQSIFTVSSNKNSRDFNQCESNHNKILNHYVKQLNSEIARLIIGVNKTKSPFEKRMYKSFLIQLVLKKIAVDKLKKQINSVGLDNQYGQQSKNYKQMITNTDELEVNLEKNFASTIDYALKTYEHKTDIKEYTLEVLKHELIKEVVYEMATAVYHNLGNGLVGKLIGISSTLSTKALFSFGSHIIKGTLFWGAVILITQPLKGARNAPEHDWYELLNEHPEFILNPEWMKEAGGQDHPWRTHCYAILRKSEDMEKVVWRLIELEENIFTERISSISSFSGGIPKPKSDYDLALEETDIIQADNTRVELHKFSHRPLPSWATKK